MFERYINLPDPLEALNTSGCTIIEAWEAVFDDEIFFLIVNMPNKYTMQKNTQLNVKEEEIRAYIAILLLTGYACFTNFRMF